MPFRPTQPYLRPFAAPSFSNTPLTPIAKTSEEGELSLFWNIRPEHRQVLCSPVRFKVVVAGRRWGKTILGLLMLLFHAASAAFRLCYFVGPTERQVKETAWPALKQIVPPALIHRLRETELEIELKNHSRIKLHGPKSLRGVGLDFAVLDECAFMDAEIWTEIIRPALADREGGALLSSTPKGFNYFFDIYELAHSQPDWAAFHYPTYAGGYVSSTELELLKSSMDPKLYAQEIKADFVPKQGRVYHAFSRDLNVADVGMITAAPLLVGMDFNVNPMTAVVAQNVGQFCHVVDEIVLPNSNTWEMMAELQRHYPGRRGVVHPDPSGDARKTSAFVGLTDHVIIRQAGWEVYPMRSYPTVDRYNSVNAMFLNASGQRRLLIDPKCRNLIRALEGLTYVEGTHTADKTSGLSHISDALGYLIMAIAPMVRDEVSFQTVRV